MNVAPSALSSEVPVMGEKTIARGWEGRIFIWLAWSSLGLMVMIFALFWLASTEIGKTLHLNSNPVGMTLIVGALSAFFFACFTLLCGIINLNGERINHPLIILVPTLPVIAVIGSYLWILVTNL